jgi:type IV fimbrial biogenesis protein FimT
MIEMVVALTVMAVLLSAAVPSYSGFISNSKVRSAAETFYAATQRARSEAIQRNELVELVLTDDTPNNPPSGSGGNVMSLSESTNGKNWVIRVPNQTAPNQLIEAKLGVEGGASMVVVNAGGPTKIQFNGSGETTSAATITVAFTHQTMNASCTLTQSVRCVSVRISVGGQARLCEPNQPVSDSRSC